MIIQPKTRGFICTTAHPVGCAENVKIAAEYAEKHPNPNIPKRILVLGSSTGYGLASRISATFGNSADSIGVFYERPSSGKRTATAGWYNNAAFEELAAQKGVSFKSINGDAFSKEIKEQAISSIKEIMPGGKIDLVVYSLAAPSRTDHDGNKYSSAIKPIGEVYRNKTVDFHTGEVTDVEVEPANEQEIQDTIKVMGGEDWLLWMQALKNADVLADNAATVSFSYIGPSITHAVYRDGTIGQAKLDLEKKAVLIDQLLKDINGKAFVSVNKALVTQASAAIPVVPLYISILYKIMKENGTHEGCTEQAVRLLETLYPNGSRNWVDVLVDSDGRIRLDNLEMKPEVQSEILQLWDKANTQNIEEISDIQGYRDDFFSLFGFGVDGIDYEKPVDIDV